MIKPHRESGGGGSKKDAKREAAQVFKIFIFAQVFKMLQILSFQDFKMIQTLKYFPFLFSRKWSTNWSQWAQTTVQPRFAIFSCKSQLRSRCLEFIKSKKSLTIIRFKPLYCDSRWTMWWQLDKSWMRRWCPSWATWRCALCKMMMMMMLSYYIRIIIGGDIELWREPKGCDLL